MCECVSLEWSYQLERKHTSRRHPRGIWNVICIKHVMQIRKMVKIKTPLQIFLREFMPKLMGKLHPLSCFFFASHIYIIFCSLETFSLFSCFQSCFYRHVFQKVFLKTTLLKWTSPFQPSEL